jgi:hypothetical protein
MKTFDGLESALVGTVEVWQPDGNRVTRAVYDGEKIIKLLMRDMPQGEAREYCDFNIEGGYHGEATPIIFWNHDE